MSAELPNSGQPRDAFAAAPDTPALAISAVGVPSRRVRRELAAMGALEVRNGAHILEREGLSPSRRTGACVSPHKNSLFADCV